MRNYLRRSVVRCSALAVALIACGAPLRAQSVGIVVVDATLNGVAGVVVMLVDSLTNSTGRALSNMRGELRAISPGTGTFLRTLRTGFRPRTSAPMALGAGQEVAQPVTPSEYATLHPAGDVTVIRTRR